MEVRDRLVAVVVGIAAWLSLAVWVIGSYVGWPAMDAGLSPRHAWLLMLVCVFMPVGWVVHWIVRVVLARLHGYRYVPRVVGRGLFQWLS